MTRYAVIDPTEDPRQQQIKIVEVNEEEALPFLNNAVGGYIEHVSLVPGVVGMYVHDEGLLRELPVNELATALYVARGGRTPICGSVVLAGGPSQDGSDKLRGRSRAAAQREAGAR